MARGMAQQKLAVDSGRWLLYRHDPRRADRGETPLQLDSPPPHLPLEAGWATEQRFRLLRGAPGARSRELRRRATAERDRRLAFYRALARPAGAS